MGNVMNNDCQQDYRGSLKDEYDIYVACAESLGWPVKSFEDWLAS